MKVVPERKLRRISLHTRLDFMRLLVNRSRLRLQVTTETVTVGQHLTVTALDNRPVLRHELHIVLAGQQYLDVTQYLLTLLMIVGVRIVYLVCQRLAAIWFAAYCICRM